MVWYGIAYQAFVEVVSRRSLEGKKTLGEDVLS